VHFGRIYQPYLIDDASHDAEMVDVLNLNP